MPRANRHFLPDHVWQITHPSGDEFQSFQSFQTLQSFNGFAPFKKFEKMSGCDPRFSRHETGGINTW